MHTGMFTSRAEAIRAAAADIASSIDSTPAATFDALKSLYAAGAPVAKRGRPRAATPLFIEAAARARIDAYQLAAANTVPLIQGIDPALGSAIYQVACELAPAARAANAAYPRAKVLAYGAQERLAGRACDSDERNNFKSRVMSRLLLEVSEILCERPDLLDAHGPLTNELVARVAAGAAKAGGERWNTSWLEARRRENGSEPPVTESTASTRAAWAALVHDSQVVLRRAAKRITGSSDDGDDVFQSALERLFRKGEAPTVETFVPLMVGQMKQKNADLQARGRDRVGHRAISLDWASSGTGLTPDQLAFGASERESQALVARVDGRLDAQLMLARLMDAAFDIGTRSSLDHAAVLAELGHIIERARLGDTTVDELSDREQLIRHLGAAAVAAGASSPRIARRVVVETLEAIAGKACSAVDQTQP
ncbi:hypothetical protein AB2L57_09505 [Microbacterium sp. HA-8]|uniref:hypothetical protein n=1 Tax=Microbacterium sp. HA-8 TaxID=3234200 RepID=UPI0038F6247F